VRSPVSARSGNYHVRRRCRPPKGSRRCRRRSSRSPNDQDDALGPMLRHPFISERLRWPPGGRTRAGAWCGRAGGWSEAGVRALLDQFVRAGDDAQRYRVVRDWLNSTRCGPVIGALRAGCKKPRRASSGSVPCSCYRRSLPVTTMPTLCRTEADEPLAPLGNGGLDRVVLGHTRQPIGSTWCPHALHHTISRTHASQRRCRASSAGWAPIHFASK
jgi:hypothetical protein